jgi:bifunctional aspartokinase / homoserine dehydrogenase 1
VLVARAEGRVLRYVAQVTNGRGVVGLRPVPAGSALANLKYVSFRTGHYNDEPLMICGKGAGVAMTAAGVIGDMVDLVREEF